MTTTITQRLPFLRVSLGMVTASILLGSCSLDPTLPSCRDAIAPVDYTRFHQVSDTGVASHPGAAVEWYRCNAGQTYRNRRCEGQTLYLPLPEAKAFAAEFSGRAGGNWRLPNAEEMQRIQESSCNNPSLNPNVFPAIEIANYWTQTPSRWGDHLGCTYYTLRGQWTCRTAQFLDRPFMLVRDR